MFLSVIIPHYNIDKALLERCIDSIIKLEIKDKFEIIVVDDGSQAPPSWIETSFEGNAIKLIEATHGGPGAARNRGIEEACGKYIIFVDADDFLINNGEIHNCIDILKEERPQILRYRYHVTTTPGKLPKRSGRIRCSYIISGATYMAGNNLPGSPCLYFFSRELAVKKGIRFPEGCFHEDEEFNTILHFHAQSLIETDALLYCYCTRQGSTTTNNDPDFEERRLQDMLNVIEKISFFRSSLYEKSNNVQKKAIDRKLNTLAVDMILNMLYKGMSVAAIQETCKERLAPLSLYPIPVANYSFKYRIFRLLANSRTGMSILRTLTHNKKPDKK